MRTLGSVVVSFSIVVAGCSAAHHHDEPKAASLANVTPADCNTTCTRVIACHAGPFTELGDCHDACESSEDDTTTAATYACLARASDCKAMNVCTHEK